MAPGTEQEALVRTGRIPDVIWPTDTTLSQGVPRPRTAHTEPAGSSPATAGHTGTRGAGSKGSPRSLGLWGRPGLQGALTLLRSLPSLLVTQRPHGFNSRV